MPNDTITLGFKHKDDGNAFFRRQEYQKALQEYHFTLTHLLGIDQSSLNLPSSSSLTPQEKSEVKNGVTSTYLNMAAVYLKLNKPLKAVEVCEKVLKDGENVKALFRKGEALVQIGKVDQGMIVMIKVEFSLYQAQNC